MDGDKFAVYQLKRVPEHRQIRFRPYSELQENGIKVRCEDYVQAYIGNMQPDETPEAIRSRLGRQLPRNFKGHSISTSDVLVLNKEGVVISYYVDGKRFVVIPGFIHNISPRTEISVETAGFQIDGKNGTWHAADSLIVDGQEFFLMEHDTYGSAGAYVVLDRQGKLAVDGVRGFDQKAVQRVRDYINPPETAVEPSVERKTLHEQRASREEKALPVLNTDGEEKTGGHNGSPAPAGEHVPGRTGGSGGSAAPAKKRASVLAKLHQKQAEIAGRGGTAAP